MALRLLQRFAAFKAVIIMCLPAVTCFSLHVKSPPNISRKSLARPLCSSLISRRDDLDMPTSAEPTPGLPFLAKPKEGVNFAKNGVYSNQDNLSPQTTLPGGITPKALGWSVAIVLALAETLVDPGDFLNGREIGYNIMDAALPLTPTDLVAVTIGEVTAGAIAPFVSLAVVSLLSAAPMAPSLPMTTTREFGQAVADADFLVARAAVQPFLMGMGLPLPLSRALAGFVALFPSQVVKNAARSRDEWIREEMERELEEGRAHQFTFPNPFQNEEDKPATMKYSVVVELFSDLLKWLAYGVMCVKWESGLESLSHVQMCTIFGILANVGSQAYMDWMDKSFLGDVERKRVEARPFTEWKSLYLSQAICGATLFGLYEGAQDPATRLVSIFLDS